jgi:xylulokinase
VRPCVAALDIGTGSVRAALVGADGAILAFAQAPHPNHTPRADWNEQDPEDWWRGAVRTLRSVTDAVADVRIEGIAACGQMHGTVPLDAAGRVLLDRVQLWNDKRPAALAAAFTDRADLATLAANPPAPSWIGFKLLWMREHQPDVLARTALVLTPQALIAHRLGAQPAIDPSEASGAWLADAERMAWSPQLADALGLDLRILPPVRAADAVIGAVSSDAAAATGLPAGLPIVCGAGDFPTALLGSGVAGPGIGSDVTGTSTLISVHGQRPLCAAGVMNLHAAGEGWVAFAMIDAGGDAVRWARRALTGDGLDFAALEAEAATAAAGAEGLLFIPYLNGDRLLGAELRAGFHGLSARHGRAHLLRAVLEGTALASAANLERMRAAGAVIERIVASGGGAKGPLWPLIKASVYGVPMLVPENPESALLGAAILAGTGTGMFPDRATAIRRVVRYAREIMPDPAAQALYRERAALFDAVFRATLPLQGRLAAAG